MTISQVSLSQAMRPAEIDAINALNEAIAELNQLDVSGINTRLDNMQSAIDALNVDMNTPTTGVKARLTAIETTLDDVELDIEQIKATLYTNLDAV